MGTAACPASPASSGRTLSPSMPLVALTKGTDCGNNGPIRPSTGSPLPCEGTARKQHNNQPRSAPRQSRWWPSTWREAAHREDRARFHVVVQCCTTSGSWAYRLTANCFSARCRASAVPHAPAPMTVTRIIDERFMAADYSGRGRKGVNERIRPRLIWEWRTSHWNSPAHRVGCTGLWGRSS